ncbi:MAG TPA: FKBP-type peptidyl-prolyl cis-trans isomerase [Streptosporangiaceae bacterium]|nr:FKBP-type peptidyl-prolyl cis-trans isomerase [Streptosporangiaceae bacterium]
MRRPAHRFAWLLATASVPLAALLAACSGGDDSGVRVSGAYGRQPRVTIPDKAPTGKLEIKTSIEGTGTEVRRGDLIICDYVGYTWNATSNHLLASSYGSGHPGAFPSGSLVPGLEKALDGRRVGSRVVTVVPPKEGYGANGYPALRIGGSDTLVYVLDVVGSYPKTASAHGTARPQRDRRLPRVSTAPGVPNVTIPAGTPPAKLRVDTVIQGGGPEVKRGQVLALQYAGLLWRGGRVFESSWRTGRVYSTTIGTGQVVKGWDQGLVGQRVGSRVLLVVPPAWAYGKKGLRQVGIKGNDTLVFIVDILGAH